MPAGVSFFLAARKRGEITLSFGVETLSLPFYLMPAPPSTPADVRPRAITVGDRNSEFELSKCTGVEFEQQGETPGVKFTTASEDARSAQEAEEMCSLNRIC